jgi:hypothetical protein
MPEEHDFEDAEIADGIAKGYRRLGRRKQSRGGETVKRILLTLVFSVIAVNVASAGVLKVATQPVRHPLRDTKKVLAIATYPVRHPVKTVF